MGVGGNWVLGIKEDTRCDEHWVFYATDELLNSTPETNDVLCVGELNLNKKKKKKETFSF